MIFLARCLNTIIRIWNTPETFTLTPRIKWVVWRSAWGDIMHTSGCRPRQLLVYSVICQNVTPRFKGEQVYIVQNWQENLLLYSVHFSCPMHVIWITKNGNSQISRLKQCSGPVQYSWKIRCNRWLRSWSWSYFLQRQDKTLTKLSPSTSSSTTSSPPTSRSQS